jgi:hypothetical protein
MTTLFDNKVYQRVELELAVILTYVVFVSRPSLVGQNRAQKDMT